VISVEIRYNQRTDYNVKRHKNDHKILFSKVGLEKERTGYL